jgi:microcystin-dependent protein
MRGDKVGIGKVPEAALDVKGDLIISENAVIKKSLLVTGNLDISGTVEVKKKITASSDISVNGYLVVEKDGAIKGNLNTNGNIKSKGRIQDKTGDVMPVGAIIAFCGAVPPEGWKICNGENIFQYQYPELYRKLGHTETKWRWIGALKRYCGELPDLRSRFIVGAGQGPMLSNYPINEKKGEEKHTLLIDEMPSHTHEYQKSEFTKSDGNSHWTSYGTLPKETLPKGGDQPHNNLPPYYALTYIIKY